MRYKPLKNVYERDCGTWPVFVNKPEIYSKWKLFNKRRKIMGKVPDNTLWDTFEGYNENA